MKEPVKFNGKPEEVTLAYPTGKKCSNGSFLYTLKNDDRILFATPALNVRIPEYGDSRSELASIAITNWVR